MKYITVREFRSSTAKLWRQLRKERRLCITSRGKPVAFISATDEREIGDALLPVFRRKAMEAVEDIRQDARKRGLSGMKMSEIDEIIAESRRARRR